MPKTPTKPPEKNNSQNEPIAGFTESDMPLLISLVKESQAFDWEGSRGAWRAFVDSTGAVAKPRGSYDPSRHSWTTLARFVETLSGTEVESAVVNMKKWWRKRLRHARRETEDPWPATSEQKLVEITKSHPLFHIAYNFPSHREGWICTKRGNARDVKAPEVLVGIDCEMAQGRDRTEELVRVSCVDRTGSVLLDRLVKPQTDLVDCRTKYHGITRKALENVTFTFQDAQKAVREILSAPGVIAVGHSLNCDLKVLKIDHRRVIDTAFLFKFADLPDATPSLSEVWKQVMGDAGFRDGACGAGLVMEALGSLGTPTPTKKSGRGVEGSAGDLSSSSSESDSDSDCNAPAAPASPAVFKVWTGAFAASPGVVRKGAPVHNSAEDARAPVRLVLHVLEHGVKPLAMPKLEVSDEERRRLFVHQIPQGMRVEAIASLFPSKFYPQVGPPHFKHPIRPSTKGTCHVSFTCASDADVAFESLDGMNSTDSLGRRQKLVKVTFEAGEKRSRNSINTSDKNKAGKNPKTTVEIAVRRTVRDDQEGVGQDGGNGVGSVPSSTPSLAVGLKRPLEGEIFAGQVPGSSPNKVKKSKKEVTGSSDDSAVFETDASEKSKRSNIASAIVPSSLSSQPVLVGGGDRALGGRPVGVESLKNVVEVESLRSQLEEKDRKIESLQKLVTLLATQQFASK